MAWQMIGQGLFLKVDMLEEINEPQKSHISAEFTLDTDINVKNLHNYEMSFRRVPHADCWCSANVC